MNSYSINNDFEPQLVESVGIHTYSKFYVISSLHKVVFHHIKEAENNSFKFVTLFDGMNFSVPKDIKRLKEDINKHGPFLLDEGGTSTIRNPMFRSWIALQDNAFDYFVSQNPGHNYTICP